MKQTFAVQTWRQARGPAGAVLCHQVAPRAHLDLSRASKGGHEIRLSTRSEEDALESGEINLLEEVGSEPQV